MMETTKRDAKRMDGWIGGMAGCAMAASGDIKRIRFVPSV